MKKKRNISLDCINLIKSDPKAWKVLDESFRNDPEFCLRVVKIDGMQLQYMNFELLTPKICEAAIDQNPNAALFIPQKFFKGSIAKKAFDKYVIPREDVFKKSPYNPLKNMTEPIIHLHAGMITHIDNPSYELLLIAVKQNGLYLEYVPKEKQTPEMVEMAIKDIYSAIEYAHNPTEEQIMHCLRQDSKLIKYIENPSEEACIYAINQWEHNFTYIKKVPSDKVFTLALEKAPYLLSYIHKQTPELCMLAIKKDPNSLEYVLTQNLELVHEALKIDKKVAPLVRILEDKIDHTGMTCEEIYTIVKNTYQKEKAILQLL